MNTFSKTIAALGIIATAWISTASADNYRLIDDLALSIARKSRSVSYTHLTLPTILLV